MKSAESKPKILVVVVHGPYQPWLQIFEHGQMKTWMSEKYSTRVINVFGIAMSESRRNLDEKIYYLRWSKKKLLAYMSLIIEALIKEILPMNRFLPKVKQIHGTTMNEVWQLQMPDSLLIQGVKNVSVFKKSLELDFDFLVTTITSSYLNIPVLEEALSQVSPINFLGGRIEKSGEMEFQQGSFRVYSRDVVANLVAHSKSYKHWKIEDIAMGTLAAKHYDKLSNLPNKTLTSVEEVELLSDEDLKTTISYRCKSTNGNMRIDSQIMGLLHQRILRSG